MLFLKASGPQWTAEIRWSEGTDAPRSSAYVSHWMNGRTGQDSQMPHKDNGIAAPIGITIWRDWHSGRCQRSEPNVPKTLHKHRGSCRHVDLKKLPRWPIALKIKLVKCHKNSRWFRTACDWHTYLQSVPTLPKYVAYRGLLLVHEVTHRCGFSCCRRHMWGHAHRSAQYDVACNSLQKWRSRRTPREVVEVRWDVLHRHYVRIYRFVRYFWSRRWGIFTISRRCTLQEAPLFLIVYV